MPWQPDSSATPGDFDHRRLEIRLNRADVIVAQISTIILAPQVLWTFVVFSAVLAATNMRSVQELVSGTLVYFVISAAGGSVFAVINVLFNPRMRRGVLGRHEFALDEYGLTESTEFNETRHKWSSLDRVSLFLGYGFVRVAGSTWHVFPRRAFSSAEEQRSFLALLRKRIAEQGSQ